MKKYPTIIVMFEKGLGFLSRGERELIDNALANLDISIDAASHVLALVNALKEHNYETVHEEARQIGELETKGDAAHQKLVGSICTGSFFGGIREDFLSLVEQIDNIADAAKDSSKIFAQRKISDEAIDYLFKGDVASFISQCIETAKLFRQAIASLKKNKKEVIRLANEIERSEEKADSIRGKVLENLLMNEIGADTLDIILLKDFLNIADSIADHSEDGSDVLLMLVAKGYS